MQNMDATNKLYGIIFDVDGVIADTEAVNSRASIKVFADLFGVEGVVREDFEAGLGRGADRQASRAGNSTPAGIFPQDPQRRAAAPLPRCNGANGQGNAKKRFSRGDCDIRHA